MAVTRRRFVVVGCYSVAVVVIVVVVVVGGGGGGGAVVIVVVVTYLLLAVYKDDDDDVSMQIVGTYLKSSGHTDLTFKSSESHTYIHERKHKH